MLSCEEHDGDSTLRGDFIPGDWPFAPLSTQILGRLLSGSRRSGYLRGLARGLPSVELRRPHSRVSQCMARSGPVAHPDWVGASSQGSRTFSGPAGRSASHAAHHFGPRLAFSDWRSVCFAPERLSVLASVSKVAATWQTRILT